MEDKTICAKCGYESEENTKKLGANICLVCNCFAPNNQEDFKSYLSEKISSEGKTILLSSHNMDVVEDVCQRVIIINHGKIVADEEIKKIKEFFQVNTYRFEVEGDINTGIREEFSKKFLGVRFSSERAETEITIDLKDSMRIYEVLDILKKHDIKLLSIQNIEPDFENAWIIYNKMKNELDQIKSRNRKERKDKFKIGFVTIWFERGQSRISPECLWWSHFPLIDDRFQNHPSRRAFSHLTK